MSEAIAKERFPTPLLRWYAHNQYQAAAPDPKFDNAHTTQLQQAWACAEDDSVEWRAVPMVYGNKQR